ncbi:MAG TPA: hypothetical protein VJI75_01455 [Candidatus Nanoarchaeia archaeon]|nr:hypothetical protein [Candidatus Nanoarchaeia archaeon]
MDAYSKNKRSRLKREISLEIQDSNDVFGRMSPLEYKAHSGMIRSTRQIEHSYANSSEVQALEGSYEERKHVNFKDGKELLGRDIVPNLLNHPSVKWIHDNLEVKKALMSLGAEKAIEILKVYASPGGRLPKQVMLTDRLPDIPVPGNYAD